MPLFKLITTLILQRTLARILNCCEILVVIYLTCLITVYIMDCCVTSLESKADFDIKMGTNN